MFGLSGLVRVDKVLYFNAVNRDDWVALQASKIKPGSVVLDAGAGQGRYRQLFAHCEYQAHDFGQEPGTIGLYTDLDYESDITEIPAPSESFDVILCTEVLEHVPTPIDAIREFSRLLRPGGTLLLTAPLGSSLHQQPYHFYGGYTPHWYRKFLPEAALQVVQLEANRGFFSWFGQEAQRFACLISPRKNWRRKRFSLSLTLLWLLTWPAMRLFFPIVGAWLDRLHLEDEATVGYHVVAVKCRADAPGPDLMDDEKAHRHVA